MAKKHPPKLEKVLRKLAHAVKHDCYRTWGGTTPPPGILRLSAKLCISTDKKDFAA